MRSKVLSAVGVVSAAALALAACGGADAGNKANTAGGGSSTVTVGVLSSLSGPVSASAKGTVDAIKARFAAYKQDGGKCADVGFNVVSADDQGSTQGTLSAAQKLVQQDHAYSILSISSFLYGATPYLTTQAKQVPVIGTAFDGAPEWKKTDNNLFSVTPPPDYSVVYSGTGDFFKSQGATKVAGVAYNSPSSDAGLDSGMASISAAGLKSGYINKSVPFGSTDVGAIVLGIKDSGADALYLTINPDTAFAIIAGLKQANYPLKAIVSPTGYGNDLLQSAPAVQAGQGVDFTDGFTPVEVGTPGVKRMAQALKDSGVSQSGIPGYFQNVGYLDADLFLYGLEKAGCHASQTDYLSTLHKVKDYDGDGLIPAKRDFSNNNVDKQCLYFLKLQGSEFVPIKGASPLCGGVVKG